MFNLGVPKNTDKYQWTRHSVEKMKYYGLSAQRVLRVIRNPQRIEEGIVEKTIAVMQPASTRGNKNSKKTWNSEIWVMYQLRGSEAISKSQFLNPKQISNSNIKKGEINKLMKLKTKRLRIISAWRYPGISPKKDPIPSEILEEIENIV